MIGKSWSVIVQKNYLKKSSVIIDLARPFDVLTWASVDAERVQSVNPTDLGKEWKILGRESRIEPWTFGYNSSKDSVFVKVAIQQLVATEREYL